MREEGGKRKEKKGKKGKKEEEEKKSSFIEDLVRVADVSGMGYLSLTHAQVLLYR